MDHSDEWITEQFIAQITQARRVVDGLIGAENWGPELPDLRKSLNRDLAIWHVATSIGLQTVHPPPPISMDEGEAGVKLSVTAPESNEEAGEAASKTGKVRYDGPDVARSDSMESDRSRHEEEEKHEERLILRIDADGNPITDDMNFTNVSNFQGLEGKGVVTRSRGDTAGERELVSGFSGLKSERKIRRDPSIGEDAKQLAKSKAVSNSLFHSMEKETIRASRSPSRSPRPGRSPRGKRIKSKFHEMEKETSSDLLPPKSPRRRKSGNKRSPKSKNVKSEEVVEVGENVKTNHPAGGDEIPS